MNELKHLKRLSAVKANTGIKFLTPAVSPGSHCPMRMASVIVENVRGLSSLLVGMPECATHSRLFNPKPEGNHGELHWLYVLDAHEVVFGCREGLMAALREMDKAGAQAILMIVTCVPELIGEDMEGVLHEVQPELSARVTFVTLAQFKNVSYPPGLWKTMEAVGTLMDDSKTDTSHINVLGRAPDEDHIPLPPLLPALMQRGLTLRYLAPGASLQDFQSAPDAALNVVVSPFMQRLAIKMEQDFGIPYIALNNHYDVESVDNAYEDIANRFGFSWSNDFAEERQRALALEVQAKEQFAGLRYILSPRIDMPVALAVYLAGLGMEPLLLHLEDCYLEDRCHAEKLIFLGYDPFVCRMVSAAADVPILARLKPDICFGYLPAAKTIPCVPDMFDFYGQVGYGRTSSLLSRSLAVLNDRGISAKKRRSHYGTAQV